MAEIRIPYDRLPADIRRRLRDIGNEVINPCATQDNATGALSSSTATISTTSSETASSGSAVTQTSFSPEMLLSMSSDQSSNTASSCSSKSQWVNSRNRLSKNRIEGSRVRLIMNNYKTGDDVVDSDCDVDEVDGGDVDNGIVHVVDDVTLRHKQSSRVSTMEVLDESDIVRIFQDVDVKSNPSSIPSDDSGIVRIFPNDDDDTQEYDEEDDDKNDVVDHMSTTHSATKIPNFVQETKQLMPNVYTTSPAFSTSPIEKKTLEDQYIGHYDKKERLSRKFVMSASRYSPFKDVRPKVLPGKSANTNIFTPEPFTSQAMLVEQYKLLKPQSSPNIKSQYSQILQPSSGISVNKGNIGGHIPSTQLCNYVSALETTPTKILRKSPSNFGKTRRSPGLLPTPPQTPDDAYAADDNDDVFSYEVMSRSCANVGNNVLPEPYAVRRNSDSRVGDNERVVLRQSTRSSPFPFSPTHKMASMRVGDRLHTRKRLSFEGNDTIAKVSRSEMDQPDSEYWFSSNDIPQNQTEPHPEIDRCHPIASSVQRITNPPRVKSNHPFNSPPRSQLQNSTYLSTSPTPFSPCDNTHFNNDHHLIHPASRVQVCCPSSMTYQSSPRPSHRQMTHPTNCQSSHNIQPSDQSYYLMNASQYGITNKDNDLSNLRHRLVTQVQQHPFRAERKPRPRICSEGFSEDSQGEHLKDVARSINSNDDDFFAELQRVQTVSSYGKRRRLKSSEDEEEAEIDSIHIQPSPQPQAIQSTPKKISPTSPCQNTTSPKSRALVNTPPKSQQPITSQTTWSNSTTSSSSSGSKNNNNTHHQIASPSHDNCSCAIMSSKILSMIFCVYQNVNAQTSTLMQEMDKTNHIVGESISNMRNIMAMCEHHKASSTIPQVVGPAGLASQIETGFPSMGTSSETMTQQSTETSPSQSASLLTSFHLQQDPSNMS